MVIPVYNACSDVQKLLQSLEENFDFSLGEVIIIDDASEFETADFLKNFIENSNNNYVLLKNETNLGFVKTCNRGMKLAQGEIVILQNSDTIIPSGFLDKVIKCFESDDKIGIACPITTCGAYYFVKPKNKSLQDVNKLLEEKNPPKYPILPYSEGECFAIRKEVIEQIGLLDISFGKGYREEIDYSFRSASNGWKNVLIDDLYVYHKGRSSFTQEEANELLKKNAVIFNERWDNYYNDFIKEHNWVNPVLKIEKKLFPIRTILNSTCNFRYINSHYVLTIMGIKVKFHCLRFKVKKLVEKG